MNKDTLIQKYKSTIMVRTNADSEKALKAARDIAEMQEKMKNEKDKVS